MPYGVPKSSGGDSPENERKMARCVRRVMSSQSVDKESAIRICKSSLYGKRKRRD